MDVKLLWFQFSDELCQKKYPENWNWISRDFYFWHSTACRRPMLFYPQMRNVRRKRKRFTRFIFFVWKLVPLSSLREQMQRGNVTHTLQWAGNLLIPIRGWKVGHGLLLYEKSKASFLGVLGSSQGIRDSFGYSWLLRSLYGHWKYYWTSKM